MLKSSYPGLINFYNRVGLGRRELRFRGEGRTKGRTEVPGLYIVIWGVHTPRNVACAIFNPWKGRYTAQLGPKEVDHCTRNISAPHQNATEVK